MGEAIPGLSKPSAGDYRIEVVAPQIPLWLPAEARRRINDLMLSTMRLALQEAAGRISDEAPVSEGILAQSFGATPATATGGIEMFGTDTTDDMHGRVFSSLPYAIVMDEGRRKGAPISRAGIDAIGLWAQRKLGLSSDQAQHAKWAIAHGIVAHGIAAKHYFEKGVRSAAPTIERLFAILNEQIVQAMVTEGATSGDIFKSQGLRASGRMFRPKKK